MIENNVVQTSDGYLSKNEIKTGMAIQTLDGLKNVTGIRKLQTAVYRLVYVGEHWTHMAITLTPNCEVKSFDKEQWIAATDLKHGQRIAGDGSVPLLVVESNEIKSKGLVDLIDLEGREFYLGSVRYRPAAKEGDANV